MTDCVINYKFKSKFGSTTFEFKSGLTVREYDEAVLQAIVTKEKPDEIPVIQLIVDKGRTQRPETTTNKSYMDRHGISEVEYFINEVPHSITT